MKLTVEELETLSLPPDLHALFFGWMLSAAKHDRRIKKEIERWANFYAVIEYPTGGNVTIDNATEIHKSRKITL